MVEVRKILFWKLDSRKSFVGENSRLIDLQRKVNCSYWPWSVSGRLSKVNTVVLCFDEWVALRPHLSASIFNHKYLICSVFARIFVIFSISDNSPALSQNATDSWLISHIVSFENKVVEVNTLELKLKQANRLNFYLSSAADEVKQKTIQHQLEFQLNHAKRVTYWW